MRAGFLVLLVLSATVACARVGDSPGDLGQKFGKPSALLLDSEENGLGVYHAEGFKEIRVTFVAGRSRSENYLVADEQAPRDSIIATLTKENPEHDVYDASSLGIFVGEPEEGSELRLMNRSREQRRYTGVVELRPWAEQPRAFVRSRDAVVEIPYTADDPEFRRLQAGITATVTVVDENSDDLDAPLAIVGRREHVDFHDAVEDVHGSIQLLVKIESGEEVLFDRVVCGVHHVQMQLSSVPVEYGLLLTSKADRYCRDRFPHARAFARGGCVVAEDSPKFTPVYICPQCVAACQEYAASQTPRAGE